MAITARATCSKSGGRPAVSRPSRLRKRVSPTNSTTPASTAAASQFSRRGQSRPSGGVVITQLNTTRPNVAVGSQKSM